MSSVQREYSEKRDFIRMVVDCDVRYRDIVSGASGTGRGRNLSGKGILLVIDREIRLGTELEIRIDSRESVLPPLHAMATVVRVVLESDGVYAVGAAIQKINS